MDFPVARLDDLDAGDEGWKRMVSKSSSLASSETFSTRTVQLVQPEGEPALRLSPSASFFHGAPRPCTQAQTGVGEKKTSQRMQPQVPSQPGNSSNDSCLQESQPMSIASLVCLVFLLGFLLNTFCLWVFCCRLPCWTSGTILQFHLALSGTIATPVAPMMAVYIVRGYDWPFGGFLCQVEIALFSSHVYGSIMFLTLISIHRYIAVVRYNQRSCMKQKQFVRWLCAGVWTVLLIQSLIYAFTLPMSAEGSKNQCLSIHQTNLKDSHFVINFILFILGFLLPFLVSAVCYGRLANSLTRLNISTAKGLKVKKRSQRMIGVCLLIFGLCFLPLNVARTLAVVLIKFFPQRCHVLLQAETTYYASWILVGVRSCMDPLLYCFGSQNFKDALQSFRIRPGERPNRSDSEMTSNL